MNRRVTHLGTSLRKRTGATKSLLYRTRRTFSTTQAHHATHYDTLSIPRNASKSQIKVSTLATQPKSLCGLMYLLHTVVRLLQGRYAPIQFKANTATFCYSFSIANGLMLIKRNQLPIIVFCFAVEQDVSPGCEQRASSE